MLNKPRLDSSPHSFFRVKIQPIFEVFNKLKPKNHAFVAIESASVQQKVGFFNYLHINKFLAGEMTGSNI